MMFSYGYHCIFLMATEKRKEGERKEGMRGEEEGER
jgi:hypothetical protein